jgi:hypothetical protein
MSGTTILKAPSTNYTQQCQSGNTYTAVNGYIVSAAGSDTKDLIAGGCVPVPSGISRPPFVSGRFYFGNPGDTALAVLTVASTLYAVPVQVPNNISLASLGISTTTGQTGGACHLGVYEDNGSGYPGALIVDSGAITGMTATAINSASLSSPPSLLPSTVWLASIFTASSTMPSVAGIDPLYTGATNAYLGADTAAHAAAASATAFTGISVAGTYGALPANFPSGATLTMNAATPCPILGF